MARKTVKKATLPEKGSTLPQVCEECRTKYLKEGVLLINPHNGRLVVLKDEAFTRMFTSPIPPHKIAFTEDAVLDRFQSKEIQG